MTQHSPQSAYDNEPACEVIQGNISAEARSQHDPRDEFIDFTVSEPYRYFLLVVGSCGCLLASFCYSFALFAQPMMAAAKMDMSAMSSAATVMLVFSYFTLPYAFIFDAYGPKPLLVIGTTLLPLGCLLMALTFSGAIEASTVRFSVFLGIMGSGCIVFDIGTVVSVLSWFPTYRGPVVAVMKTFAGLGSAILAVMEHAFFHNNPSGFFYFMMSCALVLGSFTVATMQLPPYHLTGRQERRLSEEAKAACHRTKQLFLEQRPPRLRMLIGLGLVVFLIVYLPVESAAVAYSGDVSKGAKIALAPIVVAALALYPVICLPLRCLGGMAPGHVLRVTDVEKRRDNTGMWGGSETNTFAAAVETDPCAHVTIAGEEMDLEDEAEMERDLEFIAPQFQTSFIRSLCTLRLWGIFAACFAIIGSQLVIIFHYPYICAALRGKPMEETFKALMGALSGVGSAVGRLVLAWFENYTQHRPAAQRTPITAAFFFPATASLLGLILYVSLPGDGLLAAHFIMAVGNGSAAAAAVLVFRGIFAKEPAKHYNFGFLAAMTSAIVLNRVVYAEWYQHESKKQPSVHGICLCKACVQMPLLLMLGLNALAFGAVTFVHVDYARYCRGVISQHEANRAAKEQQRERLRQAREDANAAEFVSDTVAAAQAKLEASQEVPVQPTTAEMADTGSSASESAERK